MTREEAKELLPIIQAYAEGKTIQHYSEENGWLDWLNFVNFNESPSTYRIKPEPKYRPFKNQEECWNEMLKHQPFGWIINKYNDYLNIDLVYNSILENGYGVRISEYTPNFNFEHMYKDYKFADGEPFGIKE